MNAPGAPDENGGAPETALEKVGLYGCALLGVLIILATGATFVYAAIALFWIFLPLWGAIVLGIPVGLGALALCFVGESTLMEVAAKCLMILILALVLIPVFQRAKQNAQKSRTRYQPSSVKSLNSSSGLKPAPPIFSTTPATLWSISR